MRVYYPDVAFLLNGALDYLVLCSTLRLMGLPLCHRRIALAAALGGLYGAAAILPGWEFLGLLLAKGLVALGMVGIVYGRGPIFLRCYVLFLIASCTLSGAVTAMEAVFYRTDQIWLIFLLSAAFCAFALAVVFHRGAEAGAAGRLLRAELCHRGRRLRVTLCHDTGNTLRDSETGQVVCVVERKALAPLLKGEGLSLREIPFQSLGQPEGRLLCFTCDSLRLLGRTYQNYPIGIADFPLSDGGGFVGLWGGTRTEGEVCHDPTMAAKGT